MSKTTISIKEIETRIDLVTKEYHNPKYFLKREESLRREANNTVPTIINKLNNKKIKKEKKSDMTLNIPDKESINRRNKSLVNNYHRGSTIKPFESIKSEFQRTSKSPNGSPERKTTLDFNNIEKRDNNIPDSKNKTFSTRRYIETEKTGIKV